MFNGNVNCLSNFMENFVIKIKIIMLSETLRKVRQYLGKLIRGNLIAALCLVGFVYQATRLINQYTRGQTVVNLEIGLARNVTLPAVTICPTFPAIDMLAQFNDYFKQQYNEYVTTLDRSVNKNYPDHEVNVNLTKIYNDVVKNVIMLINNHTIDLYDVLKKYTLPFSKSLLTIELIGSLSDVKVEEMFGDIVRDQSFEAMESMIYIYDPKVCKRFFFIYEFSRKSP